MHSVKYLAIYNKIGVIMVNRNNFHIVLEKQEEGGYTVYVPELPGCISQGETEKEAINNINEAMEIYLDELHSSSIEKMLSRVKIIEPSSS